MTSSNQPPSFKTDVHRAPTKRWIEAKSYTYDGDDWGGYDEYDDIPGPVSQAQSASPGGQTRSSPGLLQDTDKLDASATPTHPGFAGQQMPPVKMHGGSERLLHSTGLGLQNQPTATAVQAISNATNLTSIQHVPPLNAGSGAGRVSLEPHLRQADQSQKPEVTRDRPIATTVPHNTQNLTDPSIAPRNENSPSQTNFAPWPRVSRESSPAPRPHAAESRSSSTTSTSRSSTDPFHRRDFSPSAMPPPLHATALPASFNTDQHLAGRFPPRKSSLGQSTATPPSQITAGYTSANPTIESSTSRPGSAAGKALPIIRPADIYKRMEEEKEKERRSMESNRPSTDSIDRPARSKAGSSQSHGTSESPVRNLQVRNSQDRMTERDPGGRLRTPLEPLAERKSEYGLEGFPVGNPLSLGQSDSVARSSAPSSVAIPLPPPALPPLHRMSGFGTSFLDLARPNQEISNQLSAIEHGGTAPSVSRRVSLDDQTAVSPQAEVDLGPPSMAKQGVAADNHRTVHMASISGSQRSTATSGVSRSGLDAAAGISPIISRAPTVITDSRETTGASQVLPQPDISDVAREVEDSRPESSSTLRGHPQLPGSFNNMHARNISDVSDAASLSSERRSQSATPSGSPGRAPGIESSKQLVQTTVRELAVVSPTSDGQFISHNAGGQASYAMTKGMDQKSSNAGSELQITGILGTAASAQRSFHTTRSDILPSTEPTLPELARVSSSPISRSASPGKGRVRDLASKYNEIEESRRNSVQSPTSSVSSWTSNRKRSSSPEKFMARSGNSLPSISGKDATDRSYGKDSMSIRGSTSESDGLVPPRPHIPGEWVSYAGTTRSTSEADSLDPPRPQMPGQWISYAGTVASSTMDERQDFEDEITDVHHNLAPGSYLETTSEVPGGIEPSSEIHLTPTKERNGLRSNVPQPLDNPLAAVTAVGAKLGASIMVSAGLAQRGAYSDSVDAVLTTSVEAPHTAQLKDQNANNLRGLPAPPNEDLIPKNSATALNSPPKFAIEAPQMPQAQNHFRYETQQEAAGYDPTSPPDQHGDKVRMPPIAHQGIDGTFYNHENDDPRTDAIPSPVFSAKPDHPANETVQSRGNSVDSEDLRSNHASRESTAIPREYDRYWAATATTEERASDGASRNASRSTTDAAAKFPIPLPGVRELESLTDHDPKQPVLNIASESKPYAEQPYLNQRFSWESEKQAQRGYQLNVVNHSAQSDGKVLAQMDQGVPARETRNAPRQSSQSPDAQLYRIEDSDKALPVPQEARSPPDEGVSRYSQQAILNELQQVEQSKSDSWHLNQSNSFEPGQRHSEGHADVEQCVNVKSNELRPETAASTGFQELLESPVNNNDALRLGTSESELEQMSFAELPMEHEPENTQIIRSLEPLSDEASADTVAAIPVSDGSRISVESQRRMFPSPLFNGRAPLLVRHAGNESLKVETQKIDDDAETTISPSLGQDRKSTVPSITPQSVANISIPTFKEISGLESPGERISAYRSAREQFTLMHTGLGDWLHYMLKLHPEYAVSSDRPSKFIVTPSGLNGSVHQKMSPSLGKFTRSSPGGTSQKPYYEQYLDSVAQASNSGHQSAGSMSPTLRQDGQSAKSRSSSSQFHLKGKDLLQSAGHVGGKASQSAKGLFAKGRSRFKGSTSDKARSPTSQSSSPVPPSAATAHRGMLSSFRGISPFRRSLSLGSVATSVGEDLSSAVVSRPLSPHQAESDGRPLSVIIPAASDPFQTVGLLQDSRAPDTSKLHPSRLVELNRSPALQDDSGRNSQIREEKYSTAPPAQAGMQEELDATILSSATERRPSSGRPHTPQDVVGVQHDFDTPKRSGIGERLLQVEQMKEIDPWADWPTGSPERQSDIPEMVPSTPLEGRESSGASSIGVYGARGVSLWNDPACEFAPKVPMLTAHVGNASTQPAHEMDEEVPKLVADANGHIIDTEAVLPAGITGLEGTTGPVQFVNDTPPKLAPTAPLMSSKDDMGLRQQNSTQAAHQAQRSRPASSDSVVRRLPADQEPDYRQQLFTSRPYHRSREFLTARTTSLESGHNHGDSRNTASSPRQTVVVNKKATSPTSPTRLEDDYTVAQKFLAHTISSPMPTRPHYTEDALSGNFVSQTSKGNDMTIMPTATGHGSGTSYDAGEARLVDARQQDTEYQLPGVGPPIELPTSHTKSRRPFGRPISRRGIDGGIAPTPENTRINPRLKADRNVSVASLGEEQMLPSDSKSGPSAWLGTHRKTRSADLLSQFDQSIMSRTSDANSRPDLLQQGSAAAGSLGEYNLRNRFRRRFSSNERKLSDQGQSIEAETKQSSFFGRVLGRFGNMKGSGRPKIAAEGDNIRSSSGLLLSRVAAPIGHPRATSSMAAYPVAAGPNSLLNSPRVSTLYQSNDRLNNISEESSNGLAGNNTSSTSYKPQQISPRVFSGSRKDSIPTASARETHLEHPHSQDILGRVQVQPGRTSQEVRSPSQEAARAAWSTMAGRSRPPSLQADQYANEPLHGRRFSQQLQHNRGVSGDRPTPAPANNVTPTGTPQQQHPNDASPPSSASGAPYPDRIAGRYSAGSPQLRNGTLSPSSENQPGYPARSDSLPRGSSIQTSAAGGRTVNPSLVYQNRSINPSLVEQQERQSPRKHKELRLMTSLPPRGASTPSQAVDSGLGRESANARRRRSDEEEMAMSPTSYPGQEWVPEGLGRA